MLLMKAITVAKVLGQYQQHPIERYVFTSDNITIEARTAPPPLSQGCVREGDRVVLEWDETIRLYVPGKWEVMLEMFDREAVRKERERERSKLIKDIRQLMERWDIDISQVL
ncbi:MAG: hypothetical protein DRJ03_17350 [Chloroflexi bacterium]|nr:MAG: hypothetical protein DRJ03_17350 [Chloroflexota bacterium]